MVGLILVQGTTRAPGGEVELDASMRLGPLPGGRFAMGTVAGGGGTISPHAATHYDTDPLDLDLIPAPNGLDAAKLRFEIADAVAVYYDTVEKRIMLPVGGSILLLPDGADGGSLNAKGIQAGHMSVDHVSIYGDPVSGIGINLQAPIEWGGGSAAFIQLPAAYPMVPNLDAELLGGQHGAHYLARANHTGQQAASTISDFAAAVAATPPAAHVHAAGEITTGLLALARGGTGADGSSLAAGLVLASPSGGSGGASFRALVSGDIPALDAGKITSGTFPKAQLPATTAHLDVANVFANTVTVEQAATVGAFRSKVASDTQYRFRQLVSGAKEYGAGGVSAPDVFLQRSTAGTWQVKGAAASGIILQIAADNTVGGAGASATIQLRDQGNNAFSITGNFSPAAGARDIQIAAQKDRDGNRLPFSFVTLNAADAFAQGLKLLQGADAGSVVLGPTAALATTATAGFPYIPTCAGTPTGVPTAVTGKVPMVFDTTAFKIWVYTGGAWKATAALV